LSKSYFQLQISHVRTIAKKAFDIAEKAKKGIAFFFFVTKLKNKETQV